MATTPPVFIAATTPASDWTSTTTPKTQVVNALPGDVIEVLGGTQLSTTTLGTPTDGTNNYQLQQNSTVTGTCAGYSWATGGTGTSLAVTTSSLPGATNGVAYTATLAASGGTGAGYTWSISSASLPSWASLNAATGVISGTPNATGTTNFTVQVQDSGGNRASKPLGITVTGSVQPVGPTGTWTLVWHDEFNDTAGMSGATNGLNHSKWNVGWYYGPSAPGGTGYTGTSFTDSSGGGAIEFYGPGAISWPSGGGMALSCFASGQGPDGSSFSDGSHTSTYESGGVNTMGLMNITPNTNYSVPSNIASTVIQAANIVLEFKVKMAGPASESGAYWQYLGAYNCGNGTTPGYPNAGNYTEEWDWWEELSPHNSIGANFIFNIHAASEYGGMSSAPSNLQNTDLSLAYHTYTAKFTYSTVTLWIDGNQVSGINPSASQVQAQWATPQYINILFQLLPGYVPTGSSGATPMDVQYVRVFTQ